VKRIDCLRAVYEDLTGCAVVTIMGATAAELYSLGHRDTFFYLQHAMGLASSVGLGIALVQPERRVVVIDGDGSLLMNLGGLTTLARYRPANLTHVVFDNGSLLSVGGFPTATTTGTDLAAVASGAGIRSVQRAEGVGVFASAFRAALSDGELSFVLAQVEPVGPPSFHFDLHLLEDRFAFARALRPSSPPAV
jgi:sulfopyruvate decarboxylase subunit beta